MHKQFKMGMIAAAIAVLGAFPTHAEEIRMGAEGAYAPFNFLDPNGKLKGFDIDVGDAICEKLKADCVWSANEWSGIIPALQAKKFDVMASSMAITESRMQQVNFSNPYYYNTMRFVALKELGLKDVTPESAKGKVIGTQTGSIAVDVLQRFFPDNEVKLYPTLEEAFLDIENGRVDLVLESKFALSDWALAWPSARMTKSCARVSIRRLQRSSRTAPMTKSVPSISTSTLEKSRNSPARSSESNSFRQDA
jgi:polar amino acid transport system substrate-binding protein